jgi:predicted GH43/DUF377 family glycosyl hydrolase
MAPFAQPLSPLTYRIHFGTRDERNRSHGAWAEFEATAQGLSLQRFAPKPTIEPGRPGAFDDAGAMPGSIVTHRGRLLMYYTGWTLARAVPFTFFIGAAESRDGGKTFRKVSEAPVLGRNHHDPFLTGAPWVTSENGALRMWYVSGTEWVPGRTEAAAPTHYYSIKHATSDDGVVWHTNDRLCLPYQENEHAIARPVVMRTDRGYRMIYSARRLGETYRIYSANSTDGLAWQRDSAPMIEVASSGWDSEMVCYGTRLDTAHGNFLLYNGNAYGKDGFGAARVT